MTDSAARPMPRIPEDAVTFESGGRMPLVGLGTWQLRGHEAVRATEAALEAGYRHLDTATIYENEAEVGRALRGSRVDPEDVFVTTKCPPHLAGEEIDTLRRSLDGLGLDRVDLWLVHWPAEDGDNLPLWQAFIEAREKGLTRDIGVSNFSAEMIDELTSATGVAPVVNQVKWSPLLFDAAFLEQHRERGVAFEGYSGLRGGALEHPTVLEVARRAGRTPAQVILRWHLQHGVVAIPKSRSTERIRSNADIGGFELSSEDMAALDALGSS